jgi:hypothetical protein
VHGAAGQAQDAGGVPLGMPGGQQPVNSGVAVTGAGYQAPVPAADITQPLGLGRRRGLRGAGRPAAFIPGRSGSRSSR